MRASEALWIRPGNGALTLENFCFLEIKQKQLKAAQKMKSDSELGPFFLILKQNNTSEKVIYLEKMQATGCN